MCEGCVRGMNSMWEFEGVSHSMTVKVRCVVKLCDVRGS